MLIVTSKFTIANGMIDEVKTAFQHRPRLVDSFDGFLGIEVVSSVNNPAEILLITRWRDKESYQNWHHGHEYHDSHQGIPKGLKIVPRSTEIRMFEVIAE